MIEDYQTAVIEPAKTMAMTVIDLLSEQASKAVEVKETDNTPMTKDQYLKFQRARNEEVEFDGTDF